MASSQEPSISGALSPQNFPQSAQLDWVALSRLPINLSWEVAARLCNAGVETVTVIAGIGLCSSFSFPPDGQVELTNSLSRLKGYSSYSKFLWFGLGLKHIVNVICTTEQGATCVAISAALTIPYTSFQAAQIWRELSLLRNMPRNLIPSTHQWASLMEVCSGCLAHSKFSNYFEQFTRFLVPLHEHSRTPAPAKEIARALATLADLSNNALFSCTFVGGMECAWLAAIADYLLRLRIEIRDENGELIYRSINSKSNAQVQASFCRSLNQDLSSQGSVVQKLCFISSGRYLLHEKVDLMGSTTRSPTSWSKIFSDTFSEVQWKSFTSPKIKSAFSGLMACIALHSMAYFSSQVPIDTDDFSFWWLHLLPQGCLYHPRRSGDELIRFAQEQFPEISFLKPMDPPDSLSTHEIRAKMETNLQQIVDLCSCSLCKDEPGHKRFLASQFCLKRLALTIVRLILILSPVVVQENVPPSTTALQQLYNCTFEPILNRTPPAFPCHGVPLILFFFTGRLPILNIPEHVSAASASGICVFLSLLKDLSLSPLDATGIEVIPGHISHEDHLYTFIKDLDIRCLDSSQTMSRQIESLNSKINAAHHFELVIEEQEEKTTLGASYKAVNSDEPNICIHPGALQISLQNFLRTNLPFINEETPVFEVEIRNHRWSFLELTPRRVSLSTSPTCWSILTWDSWNVSSGEHSQWLDIEVFKVDSVALLGIVHILYSKHAFDTPWNRRGRVVFAQMGDSPLCLVQLTVLAWSTITSEIRWSASKDSSILSLLVPISGLKKKGSIKTHSTHHGDIIMFELNPCRRSEGLPTAIWPPWTRLFRGP